MAGHTESHERQLVYVHARTAASENDPEDPDQTEHRRRCGPPGSLTVRRRR